MIKIFLALFILSGCGTIEFTNDESTLSDSQAYYQSVMTEVGGSNQFGPAVYLIGSEDRELTIYTILNGAFEIRSDNCGYMKQGVYTDSSPIKINLASVNGQLDETWCLLTIQLSPNVGNTQIPVYPSYSTVYLVFTRRERVQQQSFQFPMGFNLGRLFMIEDEIAMYRVIRKCTFEDAPQVISESTTFVKSIEIKVDDIKDRMGSCYYGVVYTDETGAMKRAAYTTNVFDERHLPLLADVTIHDKRIEVTTNANNAICIINGVVHPIKKCRRKALARNLVGVFTNKRSHWETVWKN